MSETLDDKNLNQEVPAQEDEAINSDQVGQDVAGAASAQPALDEEALVAEAIRRGEEAADADLAADAERIKSERDVLQAKLAEAEAAVDAAQADAKEAADKLGRLQADWENYRRRTDGERIRERALATEKLVLNLLPVIDDMERAIAHAQASVDKNSELKTFSAGVEAVRAKMLDILSHEDVHPIDPAGEAFDPLCHQAVGRVEDASVYDETVRDVYQLGYRMAEKIIRPAMVTVTFGGAKRPVNTEVDDTNVDEAASEANSGATDTNASSDAQSE